jgi:predicted transcriptional regulator
MSIRTLISLPDDDKDWLDAEAAARGRAMTHVVQEAVAEYRVRAVSQRGESLDALLDATAGLFARRGRAPEDGATLQRRMRGEWGRAGVATTPARAPRPRRPLARP